MTNTSCYSGTFQSLFSGVWWGYVYKEIFLQSKEKLEKVLKNTIFFRNEKGSSGTGVEGGGGGTDNILRITTYSMHLFHE